MHSRNHLLRRRGTGAAALLLLAGLAFAAANSPARAEDAAAFYKGKTVYFIVGYSPGGGYDAYARLLGPHFEKRTGATVVVENKPGGGGLTALNQLVRGPADGTQFQMLNGEAAIIAQITDKPGVTFDMTKVSVIARVEVEPHFLLVNSKMPDDLKEIIKSGKKIKFSATSRTDNLGDYAAVTCEALKMNCQIITGYKGSKGASLAMMSGEADALEISESSGLHYASGGKAKIILTIGEKRSKYKPDIPTIYEEFHMAPAQKWWIDYRLSIKDFGRSIVGPPGIPADRLAYLQKVWKDILTDKDVIAEMTKHQRGIDYGAPEALKKIVKEDLESLPKDKRDAVKQVILHKFAS
jgi:tripartite-type tricarboxylate transporter receptor subunit TctC